MDTESDMLNALNIGADDGRKIANGMVMGMPRLIDAKLLLEDLGEEPYIWTETDSEIQEHSDWLRFKEMIECQPTVDAVEVVRCKDCKRWHKDTFSCDFMKYGTHVYQPNWYEEDFCSYGERKDNETV